MIKGFDFTFLEDKTSHHNLVIITGSNTLFNVEMIKRIKEHHDITLRDEAIIALKTSKFDVNDLGNSINFREFCEISTVPPLIGRWYCSVNYSEMNEKDKKEFLEMIRFPRNYGTLVVEINEYKDYMRLLSNNNVKTSTKINLFTLSFPSVTEVIELIRHKLKKHNKTMDESAGKFVYMRLNRKYIKIDEVVEIMAETREEHITLSVANELFRNYYNYDINDLLKNIVLPPKSKSPKRKKHYDTVNKLVRNKDSYAIILNLKREVQLLIKIRRYINLGAISGNIEYNLNDFKRSIVDDIDFEKISEFKLRRYIELALRSSLKDLVYVDSALVANYNSAMNEITLIKLLQRTGVSQESLYRNIGINNNINELGLAKLNSALF